MMIKPYLLALILCICVPAAIHAQTCEKEYIFRFKPRDSAGTPSYIYEENSTLVVASDLSMQFPPIIVQVLSPSPRTKELVLENDLENVFVRVVVEPLLRLSSDSVELDHGEAIFDSMQFLELPKENVSYAVYFKVELPDNRLSGHILLAGAPLVKSVVSAIIPAEIRFGNRGFFFRAGVERIIPANVPLPTFFVEAINVFGHRISTLFDFKVTAENGDVLVSTIRGQGSTQLSDFTFQPQDASVTSTRLTFTLVSTEFNSSVSTGVLTIVPPDVRNVFMFFDSSSYLSMENMGNVAVVDLSMPPIVIKLLSSDLKDDTSFSGLVIRAETSQGSLAGNVALVSRGVAKFTSLKFVGKSPREAVVRFVAGPQGSLPVQGTILYAGAMQLSLSPVKAKHLAFAKSSFLQQNEERVMQVFADRFTIPSIVVQMKDSAFQIDSSANDIVLQLFIEPAGIVNTEEPTAVMKNGIAVFSNVPFTGGSEGFSFKIFIADPTGLRDLPLETGKISLQRDHLVTANEQRTELERCKLGACTFSIAFASPDISLVFDEGRELFATVGSPIPEIRVILKDVFGQISGLDSSVIPRLIAYTGEDPRSEFLLSSLEGANEGLWRTREWTLACLQFRQEPEGMVRLKFAMVDENGKPYPFIKVLSTGFVSVQQTAVSNFGIRFGSDSLFTYPLQTSSAVVNIALPPVSVEIVNSAHEYDANGNGIIVVLTTSSGELDSESTRQQVLNGKAVFPTIKFTVMADEPVLVFTAYHKRFPVAGKSISTGSLVLTSLPIPTYELHFGPAISAQNMVLRDWTSFTFSRVADVQVKVSVTVRDSAHQFETVSSETVEIESRSNEALLQSTASKTILTTGPPNVNFTATIADIRPGYLGAPIYIYFTVIGGTSPLLVGRRVVVGPIFVDDENGARNCGEQAGDVFIVVKKSESEFRDTETTTLNTIAFVLSIEPTRVKVRSLSATKGVNHATLEKWSGVKVLIRLLGPNAGSVNRKTGPQLAQEIVRLRPGCDSQLQIESAFLRSDDLRCVAQDFYRSLNLTLQCESFGIVPNCICFGSGVMGEFAPLCEDNPMMKQVTVDHCGKLSGCRDASIIKVCSAYWDSTETSYVWLFVTGSIVVAIILVGIVLKKKGYITKQKATLRRET